MIGSMLGQTHQRQQLVDYFALARTLNSAWSEHCLFTSVLRAYEIGVIHEHLVEVRRLITGTVAPHAALHPADKWDRLRHHPARRRRVHPRPAGRRLNILVIEVKVKPCVAAPTPPTQLWRRVIDTGLDP
ncbi:hypothetical protein [Streptomyces sp. NBC_00258]|uniref:hypothetical protein n=1 Tax=Streptomyces sp. NBC_00258 TaxID=2903642 RepID=UPI002E2D49B5|nr:hypothetical protein [Streptomyces sp. NBC_00258]